MLLVVMAWAASRPGGPAYGRPAVSTLRRPARKRAGRLKVDSAGAGAPPRACRFVGAAGLSL